jgi:hypothetical protein
MSRYLPSGLHICICIFILFSPPHILGKNFQKKKIKQNKWWFTAHYTKIKESSKTNPLQTGVNVDFLNMLLNGNMKKRNQIYTIYTKGICRSYLSVYIKCSVHDTFLLTSSSRDTEQWNNLKVFGSNKA